MPMLRRRPLIAATIAAFALLVVMPAHADVMLPGATCQPGSGNFNSNNGILTCNGSTYVANPTFIGTSASAPYTCSGTYLGMIYYDSTAKALEACNGTSWIVQTGGFTGSGVTNYVARWSSATTLGTGALYDNGAQIGIGTTSLTSLLQTYDSVAKTTSYTSALVDAFDTSTAASVNKVGMDIESTGAWTGTSAINTGLVVNATGGATNYAATFNGGNVGIGTTGPDAVLTVAGNAHFSSLGIGMVPSHALQLSIDDAFKPNGGSWGNSSDERLKINIRPITDGLDRLTKLRGVTFDWRNPDLHGGTATSGGFVAQEVARVFPDFVKPSTCSGKDCELVSDGKALTLSLPFTFDAYLVEAIKELKADNDNLRAANDAEAAQIKTLTARLDALEAARH